MSSAENISGVALSLLGHLHVHSHYSILSSTSTIESLVSCAIKYDMPFISLTDSGNLSGIIELAKRIYSINKYRRTEKIKPIFGCELNICSDHSLKSVRSDGYPIVFLSKSRAGYNHLMMISSLAHTAGFHYVPRIDMDIVKRYAGDLIVLSGGRDSLLYQLAYKGIYKDVVAEVKRWRDIFGTDYYIEINRWDTLNKDSVVLNDERSANSLLVRASVELGVPLVATYNTFFTDLSGYTSFSVFRKLGKQNNASLSSLSDVQCHREAYFKSPKQLHELFSDLPESLVSITEIESNTIYTLNLLIENMMPKLFSRRVNI